MLAALLPCCYCLPMQDMGSSTGHFMQASLEGRFALVAAAAWPPTSAAAQQQQQQQQPQAAVVAASSGSSSEVGERLLRFCWHQIFDRRGIVASLRGGLLRCLLLPLLEAAPPAVQVAWFGKHLGLLAEKADATASAKAMAAATTSATAKAPHAAGPVLPMAKLSESLAAYRLIELLYRMLGKLPKDERDAAIPEVLAKAAAQVRSCMCVGVGVGVLPFACFMIYDL